MSQEIPSVKMASDANSELTPLFSEAQERNILGGKAIVANARLELIATLDANEGPISYPFTTGYLDITHTAQKPSFMIPGAQEVLITSAAGMLIVKATDPNPSRYNFEADLKPGTLSINFQQFTQPIEPKTELDRKELMKATKLTDRELDVVESMAWAIRSEEAAEKLCISMNTYRTHIKNILVKLNANSKTQVLIAGIQWGLIDVKKLPSYLKRDTSSM